MPVFDFRPGRSLKNLNPQEIGNELERIRKEKGTLTPADVLTEATPETSPLHGGFEWDDSAAAHQHRLAQARKLITSIRVLDGPAARPVTAFVSVKTPDKGRSYVPTIEAMSNEEIRARVLIEARTFIESLERRYSGLIDLRDIIAKLRQATG